MWYLIVLGVISMVAGLSGDYVLMGTNSSGALIAAGVVFVIIGCIPFLFRGKGQREKEARAMRADQRRWKREEAARNAQVRPQQDPPDTEA